MTTASMVASNARNIGVILGTKASTNFLALLPKNAGNANAPKRTEQIDDGLAIGLSSLAGIEIIARLPRYGNLTVGKKLHPVNGNAFKTHRGKPSVLVNVLRNDIGPCSAGNHLSCAGKCNAVSILILKTPGIGHEARIAALGHRGIGLNAKLGDELPNENRR